jgi:epithelial splicing regulatory protein 1/2
MAKRPYQNLILLTINKHSGLDKGEEDKEICLLAWQVIDTIKIQAVTDVEIYHICSEAATKTNSTGTASPKTLPLGKALEKLQSFLSTYSNQEHAIVTNGYRPLRQMLFPEVVKKKLTIPPSLYQFFDICKEMNKKSNSNQFDDLFSICKFLGVDCTSDSPSGEEELKVMAEVVQKMIMQDHKFDSPEMIQQHYQHSSQVNDVCEGCVVKLRGLPYSADHKDIAVFLSGLNIIPGGVVFNINQVGRRTGEAIVVLEDEQQTSLALERDHHYLNQRYIEVFEAEPDDFLELTAGNTGADNVFVIKMQGLPYRATEEDIVSFFEPDCKVKNDSNGVMIIRYPDGKATGDAFCLFPTETDVEQALKKQRQIMSGRYIELFYSSVKEFLVVLNKSGSPEQLDTFAFINPKASSTSSITAAKRGSEKNCLKLRGLPWEATPENIIDFFGSNSKNIEHQGIHMVLNSQV